MDVNNRKAVKDALTNFDRNFPIDIMIANAGVSASTCESSEDAEEAFFNVFCTNAVCRSFPHRDNDNAAGSCE